MEEVKIYTVSECYRDNEEFSKILDVLNIDIEKHILNYLLYFSNIQNKELLDELINYLRQLKNNIEDYKDGYGKFIELGLGQYIYCYYQTEEESIPEFQLEHNYLIKRPFYSCLIKNNMREFYFCKQEMILDISYENWNENVNALIHFPSNWIVTQFKIENQYLLKDKHTITDSDMGFLKEKVYSKGNKI